MKVIKSTEKITPFGGFNYIFQAFHNSGLAKLIDRQLGKRAGSQGFSYSDIFLNHLAVYFNGGDCSEDINEHLRGPMHAIRGMKVCSADTLLRGIKELAVSNTELANPKSGVRHQFNINESLNHLLVKALKITGQLKKGQKYTLDYDNQIIDNEKYDAARTYKKTTGYQPGIASINNLPVYVEGRNGNSQAKFQQKSTLERVFTNLSANGVKIENFRADEASFQNDVIELVEQNCDRFYIRAKTTLKMQEIIKEISPESWQKVRLNIQEMEVADLPSYRLLGGNEGYRLVISRIKRKDGQINAFTGDAYTYRAILTNDKKSSNKQIVAFYNQRGESERLFDVMNNDFGWRNLPCSFLSENTAFMIMTAIYANFYQYIIKSFSAKVDWLKSNFRLKKFIFRFITVPAKWIKTGRRQVLKLYTEKEYPPLLSCG